MSDTHAQSVAYVRESFVEQQTPPVSETGVVKWLRENLFSSIPYAIPVSYTHLTLPTIYSV